MVKISDLKIGDLFIYKDYGDFCYVCKYFRNDSKENCAVVGPLGILSKPFLVPFDTVVFVSLDGLREYYENEE